MSSDMDPHWWAVQCALRAEAEHNPEAKAAYTQLAAEFETAAQEIDGLIDTFRAVSRPDHPEVVAAAPAL